MDKERVVFALLLIVNVFMIGIMTAYSVKNINYQNGYWFLFSVLAFWGFIGVIIKKK